MLVSYASSKSIVEITEGSLIRWYLRNPSTRPNRSYIIAGGADIFHHLDEIAIGVQRDAYLRRSPIVKI